jgi:aminoglycoside phosphotransferase (APT) family kinase protein
MLKQTPASIGTFTPPSALLDPPLAREAHEKPIGVANPASAEQVTQGLQSYLSQKLCIEHLRFAERPTEFTQGWEAYTYHFRLADSPALPSEFARPLVVRIYSSPEGLPLARWAFTIKRHLSRLRYPVPKPLALEGNCDYFGGPFVLMSQAPGETVLHYLIHRPWRMWGTPARIADAQFRLHALPVEGFPAPPESMLDRRLREMADIIRTYHLDGLTEGLRWLESQHPPEPSTPCIVHLDFHPINLIIHDADPLTVLDWTDAGVGDRHADVGTTLMLMECVRAGEETLLDRLMIPLGRTLLVALYLLAYRRRHPLDDQLLSYYRAWAALRRLCQYGRWLCAGPCVTGSKPNLLEHLGPAQLIPLEHSFQKWTGIAVRL